MQYSTQFKSEFAETLLATAMFTRNYPAKKKIAKRKTNLYRILKVKNIRTSIDAAGKKINSELTDQLNSMKKRAFQEATSVLSASLQKSLEKMLSDYAIELPEME